MISLEPLKYALNNPIEPTSQEESKAQAQFDKIVSLIEQENIDKAAKLIQEIFEKGIPDIRLIVYYFYAYFFAYGIKSFTKIFPLISTITTDHWDSLWPASRKSKQVQSSLNWLLIQMISKLKYCEKQYKANQIDPIWEKSTAEISLKEFEQVISCLTEFKDYFYEKWPKSTTKERAMHLLSMVKDLRFIIEDNNQVEEEEEVEPPQEEEPEFEEISKEPEQEEPEEIPEESEPEEPEEEYQEDYQFDESESNQEKHFPEEIADESISAKQEEESQPLEERPVEMSNDLETILVTPSEIHSLLKKSEQVSNELYSACEKLHTIATKLKVFELLLQKNNYVKAALVAKDIDDLIENFNPMAYFPKLFANYFSLVARNVAALSTQWDNKESLQAKYLEKLYKTDLEMFIKW